MENHIKRERKKMNLTQEDLANIIGVSRQTINAIETNKYNPSVLLALKLSSVFSLTVNELFIIEKKD